MNKLLDSIDERVYTNNRLRVKGEIMSIENKKEIVRKWFKNNGFYHLDTGGNCTAMARDFGNNTYILVTDNNMSIPEYKTDTAIIGTYVDDDFLYSVEMDLSVFMSGFRT